jgi:uncharacterized Zn finger protein
MGRYYGYEFKPYVPVAQRRAQAAREVAKRIKRGQTVTPVSIEGRVIAATFWGKAWCTNLEGYSDYANRLPRGRTYVRNGSVVHLQIDKGRIEALVSGSELYEVCIEITALSKQSWGTLKTRSAGKIGTLVELLQGKLSQAVMELVTHRDEGLFPKPKEIKMRCSCPDSAGMCKHLAAVMYGVGNRLDAAPELLFVLRGVDHLELIEQAIPTAPFGAESRAPTIANDDLGAIFDIEIGDAPVPAVVAAAADSPAVKRAPAKTRGQTKTKAAITRKAAEPPVAKPAAKNARAPKKSEAAKISAKPADKPAAKRRTTQAGAGKTRSTTAKKRGSMNG